MRVPQAQLESLGTLGNVQSKRRSRAERKSGDVELGGWLWVLEHTAIYILLKYISESLPKFIKNTLNF
jgi:hypothetical protein